MTKETDAKEDQIAKLVDRSESSWRTGQIEVFDWTLVQVRKAYANATEPETAEALTKLGKHIRTERDRRFPKHTEKAAANDNDEASEE